MCPGAKARAFFNREFKVSVGLYEKKGKYKVIHCTSNSVYTCICFI